MGKIRLVFLLSLIPSVAFADAASVAETWVNENIPRISEKLCHEKATASVFDFYLKFYNELLTYAKGLRQLRADALAIEQELIEKSFHLKRDQKDEQLKIISVVEAQKQILKSLERGDIVLQKMDQFIEEFQSFSSRFFESQKSDLMTGLRVELQADGIIEDVSDWDGLYFSASSDIVETIIRAAKDTYHSALNYHKNRKMNHKLQKARDQFYELQIPQRRFLEMVEKEFLVHKDGFENGLKETLNQAMKTEQRLSQHLIDALDRFTALDHLRGGLLQKFRSEETEKKMTELKREMERSAAERWEATLRARSAVVEFEEILEWGKEAGKKRYQRYLELLEKRKKK